MSENSFPFETAGEPAPFEDAAEGGSRKPVLVVGGVVLSLVLAAGGFFLLSGGEEVLDDTFVPPAASSAAAAEPAPVALEVLPVASTDQVGRNPFKARYVEPKAAAAGTTTEGVPTGTATGTTSGTDGSTTGTTGGTTEGTTGTSSGGTPTGTTGSTPPAEQPKTPPKYLTVDMVDPGANQVRFKLIDRAPEKPEDAETVVVVKPGEVFATYFKLIGYGTLLDANNQPRKCTDLLYGDTRLKLCEGESYQLGA